MTREKIALIYFNLGGPDQLDSVEPFLFNLFYDPYIIRMPRFLRYLIAKLISHRRAPIASELYKKMGGKSPLLENTQKQIEALSTLLSPQENYNFGHFICMRYWHPLSDEVAQQVKTFNPDRILFVPLYPQYSTATTKSSLYAWDLAAKKQGLDIPSQLLCCYPTDEGFIETNADLIRQAYLKAQKYGTPRVLFSAHGLPESIIKTGDPYQHQCEQTALKIVQKLNLPNLDWVSCYQSRVGPKKWIGPATDEEVKRAGSDKVPLLIAPIAFVSEHVETIIEINDEYRHLAQMHQVPYFEAISTVSTGPKFIKGLCALILKTLGNSQKICSHQGSRFCPKTFKECAFHVSVD